MGKMGILIPSTLKAIGKIMIKLTPLINACAARLNQESGDRSLCFKGVNGLTVRLRDESTPHPRDLTLSAKEMMTRAKEALASDAPMPIAYLTALRALDDQRKMGKAPALPQNHSFGTPDPTQKYAVGYTIDRPKR